jgi:hypothetical protein
LAGLSKKAESAISKNAESASGNAAIKSRLFIFLFRWLKPFLGPEAINAEGSLHAAGRDVVFGGLAALFFSPPFNHPRRRFSLIDQLALPRREISQVNFLGPDVIISHAVSFSAR